MRRLIADTAGFGIATFSVFSIFALGVVANESANNKKKTERLLKENAELVNKIKNLESPLYN